LKKYTRFFYCRLVFIVIFGFGSLSIESPASVVFFLGLVLISFWQGWGKGGVRFKGGESIRSALFFSLVDLFEFSVQDLGWNFLCWGIGGSSGGESEGRILSVP
jgi:hypothetical protein